MAIATIKDGPNVRRGRTDGRLFTGTLEYDAYVRQVPGFETIDNRGHGSRARRCVNATIDQQLRNGRWIYRLLIYFQPILRISERQR